MGLAGISNAARRSQSSGTPLRTVWKTLNNATAVFRRGQLVVIGSGPAVGKSALALNLAMRTGASVLYFSADSGPGTQLARMVSLATGRDIGEVQAALERGHTFDDITAQYSRIFWDFNAGPTLSDIEESVEAYAYLGAYPEILIIDNLLNVDAEDGSGNEFKAMENTLLFCLELARTTGACVIVLAHLTGEYEDGITIPPLSALKGKIGKIPEMVLNLYREIDPLGNENLGVAIVKNRNGIASAAGRYTVSLKIDMARMLITDHQTPQAQVI